MAENRTPEQEREDRISSLESNLKNDFYRNVLGVNELRANPNVHGDLGYGVGNSQSQSVMTSEDADRIREEMYSNQQQVRNALGIADEPSYPTNYDVAQKVVSDILLESIGGTTPLGLREGLPLGNIENILSEKYPEMNLSVPDELKGYTGVEEGLSDDDKRIIFTYKQLAYEGFKLGAAESLRAAHKYDALNAHAQQLGEAYQNQKSKE